jgi:histidine triad (HIT) family protein
MTDSETEKFVKENQLSQPVKESEQQCVFCSIIENKIQSYKIAENKENVAILEIKPLSKGHSLIIPKKHLNIQNIPSTGFTLAKQVTKQINKKLQPKEVKISSINLFGHSVIEVLPIYGTETERKNASREELLSLQEILSLRKNKKERRIKKVTPTEKSSPIPTLKPRIP